jgi:hypothetical protein
MTKAKPVSLGIGLGVSARYKTRVMDAATGKCVKESPWQKNLILDQGLNALAGQTITSLGGGTVSANFSTLRIGSGTNAVKFASGGITFTQSGTTLTASAGFFTAAMVGGIFKWGTGSGGIENYIASYTSTTQVTLTDSMTVGTPDVGTVWQVQTAALQTLLYSTNTYQTAPGDNGITFDGTDTVTFQRTFINPVQASPYNVNELGLSNATSGTNVSARLVLSATDVVGTSNFYVVVVQLSITISPATPTAVANVGTNCDTAGNSMIEGGSGSANDFMYLFKAILSDGTTGAGGAGNLFDQSITTALIYRVYTATYSQKSAPSSVDLTPTGVTVTTAMAAWSKVSGVRGAMEKSSSVSITTAGQTWYGIGLGRNTGSFPVMWDIKFTTPGTLPSGNFQPVTNFRATWGRTLVN